MEPATKNDLKDLMKELLKELKEDIKEAVAEAFGNSKPALEHASNPAASQLLPTDARASPTTIVDVVPVLASSDASAKPELDIDATDVVAPTPTSCLTDGHGHDTDGYGSMAVSLIPLSTIHAFTASQDASLTQPCWLFVVLGPDTMAPTRCSTICVDNDLDVLASVFRPDMTPSIKTHGRVLRPAPWPSFKCHSIAAHTTNPLPWLRYVWRIGPVQEYSGPQFEIKALVSNKSMLCVSEAPLCWERHIIGIFGRGVAPNFLMVDWLEEKLNEKPKYNITISSCESGYKLLNTSLIIWRTSAVCVQYQWKVARLLYYLSSCCPMALLCLPVLANDFTQVCMYAVRKEVLDIRLLTDLYCCNTAKCEGMQGKLSISLLSIICVDDMDMLMPTLKVRPLPWPSFVHSQEGGQLNDGRSFESGFGFCITRTLVSKFLGLTLGEDTGYGTNKTTFVSGVEVHGSREIPYELTLEFMPSAALDPWRPPLPLHETAGEILEETAASTEDFNISPVSVPHVYEWIDSRINRTNCGTTDAATGLLKLYAVAWSGTKRLHKYSKKQRCTSREKPWEIVKPELTEYMFPCVTIWGHLMELQLVGNEQSNICLSRFSLDSGISVQTWFCSRKTGITRYQNTKHLVRQVVHGSISMVQGKELFSRDEFGFVCASVDHSIFVENLLDVPCVVWRTRCLMLETEGSQECWPIFQLNSPWHSSVHNCTVCTLVVVTGISPSSVQFTSKEARAWACAKMWICKNCHLALLYYNKVFEPNGRSKVVDCNTIVHPSLYFHQAIHTDIMENLIMAMLQQHISKKFYELSSPNGSPTNSLLIYAVDMLESDLRRYIVSNIAGSESLVNKKRFWSCSTAWGELFDGAMTKLLDMSQASQESIMVNAMAPSYTRVHKSYSLLEQQYGKMCTACGVQNLTEQQKGRNITVCFYHSATTTILTWSTQFMEYFPHSKQGDDFSEFSHPLFSVLPPVQELQLLWDPGGWEFFKSFTQAAAKGGRRTKAPAYSFDLIQVHLNHGHYSDDYHGDSDMIKDLQAPWDPGEFFVATAWGQAEFQEGRDVSDLPLQGPATERQDQGPAHLPVPSKQQCLCP